ncbi:hypothetical protein NQ318_015745 [Aromia moschata]|uniref:polo kinase n=1 Tax=Aromia moschata TaxID=1265417 RepID=A0AAV8X571_9CUCU|nr:hypothetical protein NQ318_015745 [Aromia moschata]
MSKENYVCTMPDVIYDSHTRTQYKKGRFFGKGAFAKCYEITNTMNNQAYAGKIVSKKLIARQDRRERMTQEIQIHKALCNKNVIGFYSSFEDNHNVYIVLELCSKRLTPKSRPKAEQLLDHNFITTSYCPSNLPVSCLTMAPRFDKLDVSSRKPLIEQNRDKVGSLIMSPNKNKKYDSIAAGLGATTPSSVAHFDARENFLTLRNMLGKVLKSKPARTQKILDEMTDPAAQPMIWVSKWVDYYDLYGFGYQLSDEGVGVNFNDTTKLILLPNGINVHYVDKNGDESYMTMDNYPKRYEKKMTLLSYFSRYMHEHLIRTGAAACKEVDTMSRTPHLHHWYRSTSGILMQLNNGTIQMNFGDHTKIIMCPLMCAITYIDEDTSFRTFRFSSIEKNGCSVGLYEKMRYAYDKITVLLDP